MRRSVWRVLRENVLCSIATVAPENRAHANTAYFCTSPELDVYFLSDASSLHARNLQLNASVAVTIFRSSQPWGVSNRGLQLFGTARPATGAHVGSAERLYGRRFPLYLRYIRSGNFKEEKVGAQLRSYRFYRLVPRTLKILDEAEFGGGVFVVVTVPRRKRSP